MQRFNTSCKPRGRKKKGWTDEGEDDEHRKEEFRSESDAEHEMGGAAEGTDDQEKDQVKGEGEQQDVKMENKEEDDSRRYFKKSHNYFKNKFLYPEMGIKAEGKEAMEDTKEKGEDSAAQRASDATAEKEPDDREEKRRDGSEGSDDETSDEENWGDDGEERCWKDGVEMKTCHRCKKKKDNWTDCPKDKRHRYCNR